MHCLYCKKVSVSWVAVGSVVVVGRISVVVGGTTVGVGDGSLIIG